MTDQNAPLPDVSAMDDAAVAAEIENTLANDNHNYHKPWGPESEQARARMAALYNRRYGQGPPSDRATESQRAHESRVSQEREDQQRAEQAAQTSRLTAEDLAALPPLSEGREWSPEALQEGIAFASQTLGLPNEEIASYTDIITRYVANPDSAPSVEAGWQALREKYGAATEEKVAQAMEVFKDFPPILQEAIDASGAGNDPRLLVKLIEIAEARDSVQAEIERIMGDPKHPYHDTMHLGHERAVKHMSGLYRKLHGTA